MPATFHGAMAISSHNGYMSISSTLKAAATLDNEDKKLRRVFLGALASTAAGVLGPVLDDLTATSKNGSINVLFSEEEPYNPLKEVKKVFGGLFGKKKADA